MFEKMKADMLFTKLLKRHDINKAYAMVKPADSWYDTITKVHSSLAEIQKLPHEVPEIISEDHLRLKGIYYPGDGTGKVTVICIHGYTSHAEREWAFPGLFYLSLGYNVLIPYQRAHGISEGKYITMGALEHRDLLGWVRWVNEKTPEDRIVLHGLSMGGGIALMLADKPMKNVKAIISDAPCLSIRGFFQEVSGEVFKKEPQKVASCAIARFQKEWGVDLKNLECEATVARSQYPILLSAGSNEHMEEALAALKEKNPKATEVLILPGCNHGNGMYKQTELYQNTIQAFLQRTV